MATPESAASGPARVSATPLPKPAEVVQYDFRPSASERPAHPADKPIKLVQWNIERGYKLQAVIDELRKLDGDVIALQEIDIHCERSGWADTGREIAQALGLAYVFVCEFEEIWSPLRKADTQGGGVHGNAILSKFDIVNARAVEHTTHPINWELLPEKQPHKLAAQEPRTGRRLTAAATVMAPGGPLLVYSAHLECFCGALARMAQLSDLFRDTREQQAAHEAEWRRKHGGAAAAGGDDEQPAAASQQRPQPPVLAAAIMGDLNTLANGVARLSPNYCTDHLRWTSLGWFEAELLDRLVLPVRDDDATSGVPPPATNAWAARQGLPPAVCKDLVNPGYADPFDARRDITFDHWKYRYLGLRLMTGKLDWVLLRGIKEVTGKAMGNSDYSASDHKWLEVTVRL